jgi:hypothetical protein
MLLIVPILVWCSLLTKRGWFWTLYFGGFALYFCYRTLRLLAVARTTEAPIAFARFDRESQCLSTHDLFGLHRRRHSFSAIGAVQLVSAVGKT